MIEIYANNASTTLANSIPASGVGSTTITVASGTGALFPTPGSISPPVGATSFFRLSLTDSLTQTEHEIVYVTARSTDVMTVIRGQDGTTARSWNAGDICGQFVSAGSEITQVQQQQAQAGYLNYCVGTGTGNAIVATFSPMTIQALTPGVVANIVVPATNSGSVTLNFGGFGAQPVVNSTGSALGANELLSGLTYKFIWDGSRWVVDTSLVPSLYWNDTSSTANLITVTSTVPFIGVSKGTVAYVKVANSNTSSVFIKINGLSNIAVVSRSGSVLQSGTMLANNTYRLIYDGTVFVSDVSNAPSNVVNEIRMWSGLPANISTAWGPGWQLADGTNGTPDLRNSFVIGAGSTYTPGNKGGSASVVLSTAQLPSHTHSITDAGHVHGTTDPGHAHSIADPGHNHSINQSPHAHSISDPGHSHSTTEYYLAQTYGNGIDTNVVSGGNNVAQTTTTMGTSASGTNISIAAAYANVSNVGAYTGIGIYGNTTGLSIKNNTTGLSINATGSGSAVPILPPFYALCYVIYTG